MSSAVLHTVMVAIVLAVYTALTITGHDGNPVLVLLGGQAIGVVTEKVAKSSNGGP